MLMAQLIKEILRIIIMIKERLFLLMGQLMKDIGWKVEDMGKESFLLLANRIKIKLIF